MISKALEQMAAMPLDELDALVTKLEDLARPWGVVGQGRDAVAYGEPYTFFALVDAIDMLGRRRAGMPGPEAAAAIAAEKERVMKRVWAKPIYPR